VPVGAGARRSTTDTARLRAETRRSAKGGLALSIAVLGMATMCFNKVRLGDWAISDLIFLLAVGVACIHLLVGHTQQLAPNAMRKTSPAILLGTLVIVVAGTASSLLSFEPTRSVAHVLRIVWITIPWFWLLRTVSPNWRTFSRLRFGVAVSVYVSCVAAIAGYLGLVSLTPFNLEGREAAFFSHPNELGGLLAMSAPLVVMGSFQIRTTGRTTLRRAAAIVLLVFALTTTGSITAVVASGVGVAAAGALNVLTLNRGVLRRFRTPLPIMLGIVVLLLAAVWLAGSGLPAIERFTELGQEGSGLSSSVDTRNDLNSVVIDNLDQSLITGVGFDSVVMMEDQASEHRVHNLYLRLIYEAGFCALVGLVAILVTTTRQAWLLAVNTRGSDVHKIVVGLFGSLVSMVTFANFQPLLAQRFFWVPIALIGVVWSLRRQELSEQADVGVAGSQPGAVPPGRRGARVTSFGA
jgi:O-antigen ligase